MKKDKKKIIVGVGIVAIAVLAIVAIIFLLQNKIFASYEYTQDPNTVYANYTFPTGYSTYGTASSPFPTSLITSQGLSVLKFDGVNNKWLTAPTDTFDIEAWQGYYVFNPSSAKTVTLPTRPDGTWANLYWVTKGWNLLYTTHDQTRSQLQIQTSPPGAWSAQIDTAVSQDKVVSNVYIIDDYQSRLACTYFTLLSSSASPGDCATSTLKKVTAVPNGKAFWVYVK